MRTVILTLAILSVSVWAFAQSPPYTSLDAPVHFDQGKVSLTMKDANVLYALHQLFQGAGKTFEPDIDAKVQAGTTMTTISLENATFEQALDALVAASGLAYKIKDGVYVITVKSTPPKPSGSSYGSAPPPGYARPVCLRLSDMPVHDAYDAVIVLSGAPDQLQWKFSGNLGEKTMPGASFYNMPVNMAAAIVVAAAGLVPPSGFQTVVTDKGTVDFAAYIPSGVFPGTWIHIIGCDSVASYKGPDNAWRYFINSTGSVPQILKSILPESVNYVMPSQGSPVSASVRLMNVTLDEALKAILEPTGYTYRVQNGVYYITRPAASTEPVAEPTRQKSSAKSRRGR